MKGDYSRSISMRCSTCGGSDFEYAEDEGPIRCILCDRIFSRDELLRENRARIDAELDEVKAEIIADISNDFRNMFRKLK